MILHAIKDYQTGRLVLVKFEGYENVDHPYTKLRSKWNRQTPERIAILSDMLRRRIDKMSGSAHSDADDTDSDESEFGGGIDDLIAEQVRSGFERTGPSSVTSPFHAGDEESFEAMDREGEEGGIGGEAREKGKEAERMGQEEEREMGGPEEVTVGKGGEIAAGEEEEAVGNEDEEAAGSEDEEAAGSEEEEAAGSEEEEAAGNEEEEAAGNEDEEAVVGEDEEAVMDRDGEAVVNGGEETAIGGGEGEEGKDAEDEGRRGGEDDDDDGDLTPPPPDSQLVDPLPPPGPPPGHGVKPVAKPKKPKKSKGKHPTTYLMHHKTLGDMTLSSNLDFTSWAKKVRLVPGSQDNNGRVWYNNKPGGKVDFLVDDSGSYRTFIELVSKMGVVTLQPGGDDDFKE